MAKAGIRFTIPPPPGREGAGVRTDGWTDVSGGRVETRMPYLCRLPSGRSIALFFYDGRIARDVAFGDLLSDGGRFAGRLLAAFSPDGRRPELVHIATDGETYGHHRKFGEMALAYCLHTIEARDDAPHGLRRCPPPTRPRTRSSSGEDVLVHPRRRALAGVRVPRRGAPRVVAGLARTAQGGGRHGQGYPRPQVRGGT